VIDKAGLRNKVKAARNTLSSDEIAAARGGVHAHVLSQVSSLPSGARIAGYEPMRTEPGSVELLAGLRAAGFEVIVPLTLPDNDLDWVHWTPDAAAVRRPLGLEAISSAALVLVPAFAVDPAGRRLGRGGGSYDRALARVRPGVVVAAVLFDGEFVDEVPVESWDLTVSAVVTPSGWRDLRPFPRG
jgi:5-formyltetrahydrofolate cyclo-ligase